MATSGVKEATVTGGPGTSSSGEGSSNRLVARLALADIPSMANVAEKLSDADLSYLGNLCKEEFSADLNSRTEWETRTEKSHKLVMQVFESKSWPWAGASNVKFPLLTIAAIQYHARAYPALVKAEDLVRYQIFGDDSEGKREKTGKLISRHMTYQLTEESEGWEESMDRTLIVQALVGCAFKKVYHDGTRRKNVSELVLPKDLVISYYARSLEAAPRLSHILSLSANDVHERVTRGLYLDVPLSPPQASPETNSRLTSARDKAQGIQPPMSDSQRPFEFVEQHRWIDFDGDGYAEPYAVVFHRDTAKVMRIVPRFTSSAIEFTPGDSPKVIAITPINYFQKFPFIPSPDGGIYDLGLGALLLPLNESVNTLVNQLIDSGTLANLGGGFLGRGAKFKAGASTFVPGEWKPVDATGDDLRKSILPLPVPQPSEVLFKLLGLLIEYSERVASATDQMSGVTPGQNTPAETSRNVLEQGLKVFNGIFKRTYRALKSEFQKLYKLNQLYLPDTPSGPFKVSAGLYALDPMGIRPAADPNCLSDTQRMNQGVFMTEMSKSLPGFDIAQVALYSLEAARIPNPERFYPTGDKAIKPPPNPKLMQEETRRFTQEHRAHDSRAKHQVAVSKMMIEAEKTKAEIVALQADARKALAEANSTASRGKLDALQLKLEVAGAKREGILRALELMNEVTALDLEKERIDAERIAARTDGSPTTAE